MEEQRELFKGELMEEKLRQYFLNKGYYVLRAVKFTFAGNEITDIDLFLYGRISAFSRDRINVDIKNKKTPKAFERILWTKGVNELLGFDKCIVATTERRDLIRRFGLKHNVVVLDGNFLQKLSYDEKSRITEEDFIDILSRVRSFSQYKNQSWKSLYDISKSRLLDELDFSGYNATLILLKYFLGKCFDKQKIEISVRATYIILSHSLLILDFILKDIAYLDASQRKEMLSDGFKYGNLGQDGAQKTIEMAIKIAGSRATVHEIKKALDTTEMDILKEYFSRSDTIGNVFKWSLAFERLAFNKTIVFPNSLDVDLLGVFSVMLDYFQINRRQFFESFSLNL